jgi:iron complex outermembrane recepter protein
VPLDPDVVLSVRYTSPAPGTLLFGTPQGGYNLVDARANIHEGNYTFTLFVDNIGDSRGITTGLTGPLQQFLVQPRTIGLTVDYRL